MEWVETTGRTLAEAVEAALDQLGVAEADLEYQVLDEPRTGLLGRLGGRDARIRARVKPISREKPGNRRRPDRRPRDTRSDDGRAPGGRGGGGDRASPARRRRRGRPATPMAEDARSEGANVEDQADVPIEEQAETAESFTRGLVEAFGAPARVETRIDDEDTVIIEVGGDHLGLLVGPRGATLSAIEELVRTVVQRQTGGHGARINIDVAGYRARRREALSEFSRGLAEKVLESGREQALEPMSAADRKVVHDAVAEIEGVTTASEGEDPRRRVVIRRA
jgi:spoIIIJ-associated protein